MKMAARRLFARRAADYGRDEATYAHTKESERVSNVNIDEDDGE